MQTVRTGPEVIVKDCHILACLSCLLLVVVGCYCRLVRRHACSVAAVLEILHYLQSPKPVRGLSRKGQEASRSC